MSLALGYLYYFFSCLVYHFDYPPVAAWNLSEKEIMLLFNLSLIFANVPVFMHVLSVHVHLLSFLLYDDC